MRIIYERAAEEKIELLTETRIRVLKAANQLPPGTDMSEVKRQSYEYYRQALADGTHIAYLVWDESRFVGAGGVSFYRVMPTYRNPSGRKAYIMNMYTDPDYRRKGIARGTLDRLISDARERGITAISLEATEMGRPFYEKYGFLKAEGEMYLPESSC